jgi:hypothetical protein
MRSFQHEHFGAGGILAGLRAAFASPRSIATFEIAQHPTRGRQVYATVRVGLEHNPHADIANGRSPISWRHAGEDGRLDGVGSHALIPDWYTDQSIEHAAATLGFVLGGLAASHAADGWSACVFRVVPVEAAQALAA